MLTFLTSGYGSTIVLCKMVTKSVKYGAIPEAAKDTMEVNKVTRFKRISSDCSVISGLPGEINKNNNNKSLLILRVGVYNF